MFQTGFLSYATGKGDQQGTLKISTERAREGGKVKIRSKDGQTVAVSIPKGAQQGMKLRLAGLGNVSPQTGRRGDLILQLKVVA